MGTRYQRARLPKPDQTEQLFGAEVVARLACDAGVPETKIPSFGDGLRCAVKAYLRDARRLDAGKIRDAIGGLSRAVEGALHAVEGALKERPGAVEKAVDALAALPTAARALLARLAAATGDRIPEPSDLRDSQQQYQALVSLYGLCGRRVEIVPGRNRPGGKQSKPTVKNVVVSPPVKRRHPPNTSELILCAPLGFLYEKSTGRFPERFPFKGIRPADHGPFVRLVQGTLDHIGIGGSADDLVRVYLSGKLQTQRGRLSRINTPP